MHCQALVWLAQVSVRWMCCLLWLLGVRVVWLLIGQVLKVRSICSERCMVRLVFCRMDAVLQLDSRTSVRLFILAIFRAVTVCHLVYIVCIVCTVVIATSNIDLWVLL
jgi:hypothetical protein